MGGATRALEKGFQQREIHEAAYRWQNQVERGEQVVVGVNRFTEGDTAKPPILRIDPTLEKARVERLKALSARRDAEAAGRALRGVEDAARSDANVMPAIVAAVEAGATLGEIADRKRAVFGA